MAKMTREDVKELLEKIKAGKKRTEEEVERLVDAAEKLVRKRWH